MATDRSQEAVDVGNRKQLFIDDRFISRSSGIRRRMNPPQQSAEPVLRADKPWEVNGTYLLTYGITFSVLLVYVVSRTGLSLSKEAFGMAARFGFQLVLSQLSDISVIALPTFFLSRHHGLTPVAVFSVGQKLAQLPVPFLVLPFQLALEPMVFKNLDNADLQEKLSNMLTYFVVVFFVTTALFLGGSRLLLAAAAPESYEGADLVLAALLPTAFFLGLASFGRVLLHARLRTDIAAADGRAIFRTSGIL